MMAVLAAILPAVSRSSSLALELYRNAAESQEAAKEFVKVAGVINNFASILKQVGTIIKDDDRLPSREAFETLEDVIEQSQKVLSEIKLVASVRDDEPSVARLEYLATHLESLRTTLSVLLQTLYMARGIMWSKLHPTISPQQAATVVANERIQLETLIIEQQMTILTSSVAFEQGSQDDTPLLMEGDSSQSLVATQRGDKPSPSDLYRYQVSDVASLDTLTLPESEWLLAVCKITSSQSERLLANWTSLPQFEDRLRDAEREVRKQKQETQQPTVESDSEDDYGHQGTLPGVGARITPGGPGGVQPLFADANSLPIPVPEQKYGPPAPLSPAASPRHSRNSVPMPANEPYSSTSPRSSIASLPVEAAAAIEAKEEDDDVDLEIPWTLCTRKYYWRYIDAKQVGTNTDENPSIAFSERNSWTEIMASWVCKEAIKEAGYKVTQVQKDKVDGRRTKWETCFCIERPLQFDQIKHLVERTVELYRKTTPPTPPPQAKQSPFQPPPPPPVNDPNTSQLHRDRRPVARNTHPPLARSTSSMPSPAPFPPPLNRSLSTPGPGLVPPLPQQQQAGPTPHASALQIPIPPASYAHLPPPGPQSPHPAPYPRVAPYPPQIMHPHSPHTAYPPVVQLHPPTPNSPLPPPSQPNNNLAIPQSPRRQSYRNPPRSAKYDDTSTSSSESGERERSRRRRSKSRSRYASAKKKRSSGTSSAVGALVGVGGLTALLDGLSGL